MINGGVEALVTHGMMSVADKKTAEAMTLGEACAAREASSNMLTAMTEYSGGK